MKRTVVHVLRHGEVYNPGKILYGRLPGFKLSELGVQMAKAASQALADRDVVHVVASPLERAQETAEPIAAQFRLPVSVDERLIESANWFEGQRVSPATARSVTHATGGCCAIRSPRPGARHTR